MKSDKKDALIVLLMPMVLTPVLICIIYSIIEIFCFVWGLK